MPTTRSSAHVRRAKLRGDDAIVFRMWACTAKEVADFAYIPERRVVKLRGKLGIRKRGEYHIWTTKDFAIVRSAKRMMHPLTTALPHIGVSPKALWSAIERNPHLAA